MTTTETHRLPATHEFRPIYEGSKMCADCCLRESNAIHRTASDADFEHAIKEDYDIDEDRLGAARDRRAVRTARTRKHGHATR